jgi:hypothetical protein
MGKSEPTNKEAGWNSRLTPKRLVYIMWVCLVLGFLAYWAFAHAQPSLDRARQVVDCTERQVHGQIPVSWDCQRDPA